MNEPRKSDSPIVLMKSPNKAGQPAAEGVEGRGLAKGNLPRQNAPRTQCRQGAYSAPGRVRHAVRNTHRVFLPRADVTTQGRSRMREFRSSGSVEGVMGNHDFYSDPVQVSGNLQVSSLGDILQCLLANRKHTPGSTSAVVKQVCA